MQIVNLFINVFFIAQHCSSNLVAPLRRPAEFQFNTCSAGLAVLLPVYLLVTDLARAVSETKLQTVLVMVLNGVLFHFQTMMAWVLMEFLSPVTHRLVAFFPYCRLGSF